MAEELPSAWRRLGNFSLLPIADTPSPRQHRLMKLRSLLVLLASLLNPVAEGASSAASAASPSPPSRSELGVDHISFSTEDGAVIYADVYGAGERGVVLAHGGRLTKESWKPQAQQLARAGFHVLAFDFRGFGQSHGPGDSDPFTAPMQLDVLAAVRQLRKSGAKSVAVVGGSFGGSAAADASIGSAPGEINRLVLLAAEGNGSADEIKVPLLEIVARNDANDDGPRLPRIRAWFNNVPQPKKLIVLDGSAHAQFLFQTNQSERIMKAIIRFLSSGPAKG